jgi:hypothetical protein
MIDSTTTDYLQHLPMLRLREEMLRRAKIALGEAQVLSAMLDYVKNRPLNALAAARPVRTLFGFQLLHSPHHLSNGGQETPRLGR